MSDTSCGEEMPACAPHCSDTSDDDAIETKQPMKRPASSSNTGEAKKRPACSAKAIVNDEDTSAADEDMSQQEGQGSDMDDEGEVAECPVSEATNMPKSLITQDVVIWALEEMQNAGALADVQETINKRSIITVGSLCSGIGTDVIAATALNEAWALKQSSLGTTGQLHIKHVMLCEISKTKRDVLMASYGEVPYVFDDVTKMGAKSA